MDISCPSLPTEGRGGGHAVTFPFNSLVGPPVVEGWGGGAPATQSPRPPTRELKSGGLDGTQRGAREANSFPIAERVGGDSADLNHMVVKKK